MGFTQAKDGVQLDDITCNYEKCRGGGMRSRRERKRKVRSERGIESGDPKSVIKTPKEYV